MQQRSMVGLEQWGRYNYILGFKDQVHPKRTLGVNLFFMQKFLGFIQKENITKAYRATLESRPVHV